MPLAHQSNGGPIFSRDQMASSSGGKLAIGRDCYSLLKSSKGVVWAQGMVIEMMHNVLESHNYVVFLQVPVCWGSCSGNGLNAFCHSSLIVDCSLHAT